MSLDGTNSYLMRAPEAGGPLRGPGAVDERHLQELAGAGPVELIRSRTGTRTTPRGGTPARTHRSSGPRRRSGPLLTAVAAAAR